MSSVIATRKPRARRSRFAGLMLAALALCATPARASSTTDSFDVTATVISSCSVVAQDLTFGNYDPVSSTPLDAATTMSVTCTNGTAYQVALGLGNGTGATTTTRYMVNGANKLGYTLYRDSNRTLLWGQTVGTDTLSGTGTGAAATVNVYGRVAIAQTAIAGAYQDTVVVTVSW